MNKPFALKNESSNALEMLMQSSLFTLWTLYCNYQLKEGCMCRHYVSKKWELISHVLDNILLPVVVMGYGLVALLWSQLCV